MMKKIIAVLLLVSVLLVGCIDSGGDSFDQSAGGLEAALESALVGAAESVADTAGSAASGTVGNFGNAKCTYNFQGQTLTYWFAPGKVKTQIETTFSVMKDKKLYSWTSGEKEGIVMSVEDDPIGFSDYADLQENAELFGFEFNCVPGVVSDADFAIPTDVEFQNIDELYT